MPCLLAELATASPGEPLAAELWGRLDLACGEAKLLHAPVLPPSARSRDPELGKVVRGLDP